MAGEATLSVRIVLVTGATRGIGHAAALELARQGAHVIAAGRAVGALEELDDAIKGAGGQATLVPFDLKDHAAIDRLAAGIAERWERLDGLLANAAMLGPLTPLPHLDPKAWGTLVDVNLTAQLRLVRAMDPLLRAAPSGRAVFVTSGIAERPRAYWGGYAATKAALNAAIFCYADETRQTALRVNLYNPGATRTRMRAQAMPGEDPETLPAPELHAPILARLLSAAETRHGQIVTAGS